MSQTLSADSAPVLTAKPKTLDALTGLRFIAALAVVLVHAMKYADGVSAYNAYATNAVAFFFVLSGFILTYVYHDRLWQVGVIKFYFARFARIWPLHVVCLVAAIAVQYYYGQTGGTTSSLLASHLSMLQSWIPIEKWSLRLNGPAWSISTEFGFYFVFPVLLWLGRKQFWPIALVSILATVAMVVGMQYAVNQAQIGNIHAIDIAYVNPLFRVVEFVIGMWVGKFYLSFTKSGRFAHADGSSHSRIAWVKDSCWELLAIGFLIFLFREATMGHLHEYLQANRWQVAENWIRKSGGTVLGFAAIVWVFSWSRGFLSNLLSTRTAVYLGEISFALYLIQIPVLTILKYEFNGLQLPMFYFVMLAVGLCLSLAMLLFAVIEMPCRQFLVAAVSGNWPKAWSSAGSAYQRVRSGYVGAISIGLLALCGFLLKYEKQHPTVSVPAREVLGVLDSMEGINYSPVTFKDEAILHWWDVREGEKNIEIKMWWEILEGQKRARFLHISDEQGELIYNGPSNTEDFVGAPEGSFVIDHCRIDKSIIKPGMKYVGIGFYAKGIGTTPADSGNLQMEKRRLLVADISADGATKVR